MSENSCNRPNSVYLGYRIPILILTNKRHSGTNHDAASPLPRRRHRRTCYRPTHRRRRYLPARIGTGNRRPGMVTLSDGVQAAPACPSQRPRAPRSPPTVSHVTCPGCRLLGTIPCRPTPSRVLHSSELASEFRNSCSNDSCSNGSSSFSEPEATAKQHHQDQQERRHRHHLHHLHHHHHRGPRRRTGRASYSPGRDGRRRPRRLCSEGRSVGSGHSALGLSRQ